MMWPVLTKVQYEQLPIIFRSTQIWYHIALSFVLNWVVAPFVMLGVGGLSALRSMLPVNLANNTTYPYYHL